MTLPGFVEYKSCPICGGADLRHHKTITSPPNLILNGFCYGDIIVRPVVSYSWCTSCDLIFQNPRMTSARISHYYSSGLYRSTLGIEQDELDKGERLRGERLAAWLRVRKIKPASHLDIGCSRTYFLDMVHAPERLGFDENIKYAGDGIYVENVPEKLGRYELVSAIHVLEHTTDPLAALEWWAALTTRWLLVEVPQRDATLRFPHLFYFPPKLLIKMFKDLGMKVEQTERGDVTGILAIKH